MPGSMSRLLRPACAAVCAVLLASGGQAAAQAADPTTVERGILDVLLQRGIIGQEEYEELVALSRAGLDSARAEVDLIEGRLERLRAPDVTVAGGKPGRLQFSSPDGNWSLAIKGWLQARLSKEKSDDETKDFRNISVPRARVGFEGVAGTPKVKYRIEIDAPTEKTAKDPSAAASPNLRHAYVDWELEHGASLLVGQTKFPFGREQLTGGTAISFSERSVATEEFTPSYEPLAMVKGTLAEGEFEYYAAVSNGEGRSKNNTPGKDASGMRKGVRAVWNPLGAVRPDGPAFQTVKDGGTKVSIGASYMRNDDVAGLATHTAGADTDTFGLEFQAFMGPTSLLLEHFDRSIDSAGGAADVDDSGFVAQFGIFVDEAATWELVARHSRVDFDAKDDVKQCGIGVNRFLAGQAAKWQLHYDRFDRDGASADSDRLTLQYQAMF